MRLPVLGIGACVGAAASLCMLIDARQAAGAFPGANGVIVTVRCDDGISCRAQHL